MPEKKKAPTRRKKTMDDETITQTGENGVDSSSVEDRVAAIEALLGEIKDLLSGEINPLLAEIKDHLSGEKTVEREREAHATRHTKIPYQAPELPAGLSPNQILQHPLVKDPGLRAEAEAAIEE